MGFLLRILILFLLVWLIARAAWRFVAGVIVGASGQPPLRGKTGPERGVAMVRDPVCGTFLLPADALTSTERGGTVRFFCSEACRQRFEAHAPVRRR